MRGLGVLAAGVIVIAIMYFYFGSQVSKDIVTLPVAFGKPDAAGVEFNVAVSMFMPRKDPPKLRGAVVQWDEWVSDHFQLTDASGAKIPLQRVNFSKLMDDRESGGTPEFWLKATLKPGATYRFGLTPILPAPKYHYSLVAPTGESEATRVEFEEDE
ncbi:MAG: hypothetical protein HZB38_17395 [Planctomycetes bacterium]|nr:hypothetical protein [Planctomycetota bacterium]